VRSLNEKVSFDAVCPRSDETLGNMRANGRAQTGISVAAAIMIFVGIDKLFRLRCVQSCGAFDSRVDLAAQGLY
jgi:hypothetical protein